MTASPRLNDDTGAPAQHPSAQILNSAAALARAEVRLLWSHVRQIGGRAGAALGLTLISILLTQTALLMLAASPLIFASYGGKLLAASVGPVVLVTAIAWGVCVKKWMAVSPPSAARSAEDSALELTSGELGRR